MSLSSSIRVMSVPHGNLNSISYGILRCNLVLGGGDKHGPPKTYPMILKFDTGTKTEVCMPNFELYFQ